MILKENKEAEKYSSELYEALKKDRIDLKKCYKSLSSRGKEGVLVRYCDVYNNEIQDKYCIKDIKKYNKGNTNFQGTYSLKDYVPITGEKNFCFEDFFYKNQKMPSPILLVEDAKSVSTSVNVKKSSLRNFPILIHKSFLDEADRSLLKSLWKIYSTEVQICYVPLGCTYNNTLKSFFLKGMMKVSLESLLAFKRVCKKIKKIFKF